MKQLAIEIDTLTPMMRQYLAIKSQHQDYLLFYRMGDFYELFFEDAILASQELNIILTKRGSYNNKEIPMCGVPFHSSEAYLHKLIKNGHNVAICEQLETPQEAKKRGHKAVVRREVTRIITPGTILEENLLDTKEMNYLSVIHKDKDAFTLAYADISTGNFLVETLNDNSLELEIARLNPKEIIISEQTMNDHTEWNQRFKSSSITIREESIFDFYKNDQRLKDFYRINSLTGLGNFTKNEIIASGVLIEYLQYTQKQSIPILKNLKKAEHSHFMAIDKATRYSLELNRNLQGEKKNSLLNIMDETMTKTGSRLLSLSISSPLSNANAINKRLNNVESFVYNNKVRNNIREMLKNFPDVERSLSKITANRYSINDLLTIKSGMITMRGIFEYLYHNKEDLDSSISGLSKQIMSFEGLDQKLKMALQQTTSDSDINSHNHRKQEGLERESCIKRGYDLCLDNLYNIQQNTEEEINKLRLKYRNLTEIQTLKITKNNILGYYIEITPSNLPKIKNDIFIKKQTLTGSIRFTTQELQKLAANILESTNKIQTREKELISELCEQIIESAELISTATHNIGKLDLITNLAHIAVKNRYTKPIIDESYNIQIEESRHPVVEENRKKDNKAFTKNSCFIDNKKNILLITGPNMAGKSTFLRQIAIIIIMAQIGSFVPAEYALIGVVDKIFSRIGTGDNIAQGQSTFMIEMLETAYIMNNSSPRSFIVLDEIGRGTSTHDGLAIAWAIIENIHNKITCRTIFATHYHELTKLEETLPKLICKTTAVKEIEGTIIFLHKIVDGKADKSYGIHVAELAGMPKTIIKRSYDILKKLNNE